MSEENVELAYRAADAFNRRDIDAFVALCDPEVEWSPREPPSWRAAAPTAAMTAFAAGYGALLEVFPDFGIEIQEVRDLGNVTVAGSIFAAAAREATR